MERRVTARQVAERAGVSRATVSFVLNDSPGMRIRDETRTRVLNAARDLGYHPNASARRLVTGQTNLIAYVERQAPERAFTDTFWPEVLRGVHDAARASDHEVLFAPDDGAEPGDGRCTRLLRGNHVDGVILSGPRSDDREVAQLIEESAAIVLQGDWPGVEVPSVDIDNQSAARSATEHLIRLGHRRIGALVHAPPAYTAAEARLQGYLEALEQHSVPLKQELIARAHFTPASGERALQQLLELESRPTAVFATSDTVAIGAMRAARRAGLSIPQDLALVGFDDVPISRYVDPPLTSVRLPAYRLGWACADLLFQVMEGETQDQSRLLLDTELIVRRSCGAHS